MIDWDKPICAACGNEAVLLETDGLHSMVAVRDPHGNWSTHKVFAKTGKMFPDRSLLYDIINTPVTKRLMGWLWRDRDTGVWRYYPRVLGSAQTDAADVIIDLSQYNIEYKDGEGLGD